MWNSRHVGKFYITSDIISSESGIEYVQKILALMQFVPTRVEFIYHKDVFEYIGLSPLFEDWPLSCEIPEYRIQAQSSENHDFWDIHDVKISRIT